MGTPLYIKIGNRVKGEAPGGLGHWVPGSISNISFRNVTAVHWGNVSHPKPGHGKVYTATIEGLNESHRVGPIRMQGFQLVAPGGGSANQTSIAPPMSPLAYQPRYVGTRPSWGLFVRYAEDIWIEDAELSTQRPDARAPMVLDHVDG